MALLLDLFGFLSVVLRGLILVAQSLTVGGVVFLMLLAQPLAPALGRGASPIESSRRLLRWSAVAFAGLQATSVLLECSVLMGTADLSPGEALSADFALFGAISVAAAAIIALLAAPSTMSRRNLALPALAMIILLAQVAASHAAAQLTHRAPLMTADFLHMLAAGAWIGGIPYFLMSLRQVEATPAEARIARRFSLISMGAVALLIAGGVGMALPYIGSLEAIYGTAYGVMVATKVLLLLGLLALGGMNFLTVERLRRGQPASTLRLRRFAEVEIGIGLTVFFAAASLTSQPPAADLVTDRLSLVDIGARLAPHWPRLQSPDHASLAISELQARFDADAAQIPERPQAYVPGEGSAAPRNAEDIAWSEYNHHWAGLLVLAMGLLALLERTGGAPWARHWPLLLLGLAAFIVIRADPEVWPLGSIGFFASLRDPEVVQHRVFALLIAAFALFEWRVRTGGLARTRAALVFPLITAVGGALLLTHSHALANLRDQLLIEISHAPLAICGISAGWARWLELRLEDRGRRIAGWVWPVAFVLVGSLLLLYREA